jgi:hypothetical protein
MAQNDFLVPDYLIPNQLISEQLIPNYVILGEAVRIRILHFLILLSILILNACTTNGTPTPYPSEVNWETAVRTIHSGQVGTLIQLHSLDVTLTMKDGSRVRTVEPFIDAVFQEVDECGIPCKDIILATE